MKRLLRRRLLVVFPVIALLLATPVLRIPTDSPGHPAHAQEEEIPQSINIRIGEGTHCEGHGHWLDYVQCPYGPISAITILLTELSCPVQLDVDTGAVSGEFRGRGYDSTPYFAGLTTTEDLSINGRIIDGWVKSNSRGDWRIGGKAAMTANFSYSTHCWDPVQEEYINYERKETVQMEGDVDGLIFADASIVNGEVVGDRWYFDVHSELPGNQDIYAYFACEPPGMSYEALLDVLIAPDAQGEEDKLDVQLGCSAVSDGEGVTCNATVQNPREGETFVYHWYVDSAAAGTTDAPSVDITSLAPGTHDVGVQVVGENRSVDTNVTVKVEGEQIIPDKDGDGIPNDDDACPDNYAPNTWNGCPEEQQRDASADDKSDEEKSNTMSDEQTNGTDVLKQLILRHKGRLEDIPGWEQLSPQTQEQLRQLAVSLDILAQASQTSSQPGGQAAEGAWTGGGTQSGQDTDAPPDNKQPKREPAIQLTQAQQALKQKLENQEKILSAFNKAWYSAKVGETLYRIGHGLSTIGKAAYDKYNEWNGVVSDPEQVLIQKIQDYQKDTAIEAGKEALRQEGILYGEGTEYVSEQEFAQAVFEWVQATTQAVVPIHYTYYRQAYDQNLPPGRDPTDPEKQQAHQNAMAALRDRLAGRNQQTLTDDVTQRQAGELGPTGKLGYAWTPKYLEEDNQGRDIMGYMDAYEKAFPELNEHIDVD